MKKLISVIPFVFITAVIIFSAVSIKGGALNKQDIPNDSDEVEIVIKIDSIIDGILDKDFLTVLDTLDFALKELENIDIHLDSFNFDGLEDFDIHLESVDLDRLDEIDIHLDSLDVKLDNLDIELEKLNDSLNVKKIKITVKRDEMDSLECKIKELKIELSDKFRNMKDSMKIKMHKMKGEIKKDIKIKQMQKFKDYKNMSDGEIIESLKEDGIIENENEVDINREDGKITIKITKEKLN